MSVSKFNRLNSVSRVTGNMSIGGVEYPSSVGVATTTGGKTILTYNSSGTIRFRTSLSGSSYNPTHQSRFIQSSIQPTFSKVDYLVIAGGGFGGSGGGGGGGFIESLNNTVTPNGLVQQIVVGGAGNNSSIAISSLSATAIRGGSTPSGPGGSGGGASRDSNGVPGGSGTPGQGNPGGRSLTSGWSGGGGGGGAGGAGGDGGNTAPGPSASGTEFGGPGGAGKSTSITGAPVFYSRGGGGRKLIGTDAAPGGPAPFGQVNSGDAGQSGRVIIVYYN